jgi:hypothetical protein
MPGLVGGVTGDGVLLLSLDLDTLTAMAGVGTTKIYVIELDGQTEPPLWFLGGDHLNARGRFMLTRSVDCAHKIKR